MQHHPWLAHITHGVCALAWRNRHRPTAGTIDHGLCSSCKRRKKMECNISKGLHVLLMACVHQKGDICISQCKAPSAKAYALHGSDVGQQNTTLDKACMHHPWCVCIGLATLMSANDMHHQPRLVRFGQATLANARQH